MNRKMLPVLPVLLVLLPLAGLACVTGQHPTRHASSALEFLYPEGQSAAVAAADVRLDLPVRVGLAFAPRAGGTYGEDPLPEGLRKALLDRVAAAFRETRGVEGLEVVPSLYLTPGGGFAALDRLKASLGLDLIVLLSYDQTAFTESTRASWTYLTVIGPLLIEGEQNEVSTVVDAVVYDIPSRALLFRAAGGSTVGDRSSPLNERRKRRELAEQGFEQAIDDLVGTLQAALDAFEAQAQQGTVRGQGTPQIALFSATGERLNPPGGGGGGGGAGALGAAEAAFAALLAGAAWTARRRTARPPR